MVLGTAERPGAAKSPATPPDDIGFRDSAEALRRLARFHAEEPTPALLTGLRQSPAGCGPLALDRDDALQAAALVDEVVSDLPERITRRCLAALAADFTAIHHSGELRACPTEGAWLDERVRAEAAASLQRWRIGLETDLRRPPFDRLPDDHVAVELALLATLLDRGRAADSVRFLDRHPLRWVPSFCSRIATRCREPFFAGIAILTNAHLDHLRDRLGAACNMPRPGQEEDDVRRRRWTEGRFPRACTCES
ncbi:TorD/DmsD family molecular chaperone [Azospirillum humicireducens]|nr:molecular chaperone TorD family protein [Azospirillum humicireducens]